MAAPKTSPQEPSSSTDKSRVQDHIREAITHGRLKPGEHLKESRLAEETGVSRFHIREALRHLQAEGLVEAIPYRGNFVKQFSNRDAMELFTIRSAIEELAVRLMITRLTKEMVEQLEELIHMMEEAEKNEDTIASAIADLEFHRTLCRYSGNRRLLNMWDTLVHHVKLYLFMEKSGYGRDPLFAKSHLALMEAIKQRDTGLAQARLRVHLDDGIRYLIDHSFVRPDS